MAITKKKSDTEVVLLITGSRTINNRHAVYQHLYNVLEHIEKSHGVSYDSITIIHGHCPKGVDHIADVFAQDEEFEYFRFPAEWNKYGKSAGHRRNQDMAIFAEDNFDIKICVAIWDGVSRGTRDMIDIALAHGFETHVFVERQ